MGGGVGAERLDAAQEIHAALQLGARAHGVQAEAGQRVDVLAAIPFLRLLGDRVQGVGGFVVRLVVPFHLVVQPRLVPQVIGQQHDLDVGHRLHFFLRPALVEQGFLASVVALGESFCQGGLALEF